MQPAVLIYNPRAGSWRNRRLIRSLEEELATESLAVEAVATSGPGNATQLARQAVEAGSPLVFALGGDGTLREVAAGLLGSETVLGALPGGTTNVVVRTLGLPTEPMAAARALKQLPMREIDVGLCGDEVFLMQASLGLDGRILERVSPVAKRLIGRGAVGLAGLAAWWTYEYPEFEVLVDGHSITASFVAVCNLPLYAGAYSIAPSADPGDGLLDVVLFRGQGRRETLAFARDLRVGRHIERDDVTLLTAREVVLTDPDIALQIDGDVVPNRLGTELRLAEAKLRVLAGSTIMGGS